MAASNNLCHRAALVIALLVCIYSSSANKDANTFRNESELNIQTPLQPIDESNASISTNDKDTFVDDGAEDPEYIDDEMIAHEQLHVQALRAEKPAPKPPGMKATQFSLNTAIEVAGDFPVAFALSNHRLPAKVGSSSYSAIATRKGYIIIHDSEGNLLCNDHAGHKSPISAIAFTGKDSLKGAYLITGDEDGAMILHKLNRYKKVVESKVGRKKKYSLQMFSILSTTTLQYSPPSKAIHVGSYDRHGNHIIFSLHADGHLRQFSYDGSLTEAYQVQNPLHQQIVFGKSADVLAVGRGNYLDLFDLRHKNTTKLVCPEQLVFSGLALDITRKDIIYATTGNGRIVVIRVQFEESINTSCQVVYDIPAVPESISPHGCKAQAQIWPAPDHIVVACMNETITVFNTTNIYESAPRARSAIFYPIDAASNDTAITLSNRSKQLMVGLTGSHKVLIFDLEVDFPTPGLNHYKLFIATAIVLILGMHHVKKKASIPSQTPPQPSDATKVASRTQDEHQKKD